MPLQRWCAVQPCATLAVRWARAESWRGASAVTLGLVKPEIELSAWRASWRWRAALAPACAGWRCAGARSH
eukprot:2894343-Pyramimonas_sp.AAC.1